MGQRQHRHRHRLDFGAGCNRAEPACHFVPGGGQIDIAGQHDDGIVGRIMIAEPRLDIVKRGGVEIVHRSQRDVVIGIARGIQRFLLGVFGQAIGLVVVLALFIFDHGPLRIDARLRHRGQQPAHAIAFHHQRAVQCPGRHGFEVIGAVKPGRAIGVGCAHFGQRCKEIARIVFGPVEHQMFEQVRKAGAPARLVL